jgi:RHS repeat-associated protein
MRVFRTQAGEAEPSVHAQYLYDAAGQRVKKVIRKQSGKIEVTIYVDGLFEHQRIVQGGTIQENNMLHVIDHQSRIALVRIGSPIPDDTTPAVKFHLGDHLGSSQLVINESGAFINREEYTPYGESSFGSFAKKGYRFTGKERDEESALYYHGARYYAPWLMRWVSCDPIWIGDGINIYAYVANRPLNHLDIDGRAHTPIHEDLTTLIATQYVDKQGASEIGKATQAADEDKRFDSVSNSVRGDPLSINKNVHVLSLGRREGKVKSTIERAEKEFTSDTSIGDAGKFLLHPLQDANYHRRSAGRGAGHAVFPEDDLAVGNKTFEEFYQVIVDTERGLDLMQDKGIITTTDKPRRLTKDYWKRIYGGLKSIESKYRDRFAAISFLGTAGIIAAPITGLIGGALGGLIGAIIGFFAKPGFEGLKNGAKTGFIIGQAILGAGVGITLGLGLWKGSVRNEVAEEQSNYLKKEISTITAKATP